MGMIVNAVDFHEAWIIVDIVIAAVCVAVVLII
jgi:hypothetical protein